MNTCLSQTFLLFFHFFFFCPLRSDNENEANQNMFGKKWKRFFAENRTYIQCLMSCKTNTHTHTVACRWLQQQSSMGQDTSGHQADLSPHMCAVGRNFGIYCARLASREGQMSLRPRYWSGWLRVARYRLCEYLEEWHVLEMARESSVRCCR